MLAYASLKIIWWMLLGLLFIGFAITDGFDLGAAALLTWVARKDTERRVVLNALGPVWESNQVWLILGAGAIFAAWPLVYAVSFSVLMVPLMLVLACLILRPVAFKFRSKLKHGVWRCVWDHILCGAGMLPALLLGVAVGNAMLGLPYSMDDSLRISDHSNFLVLLRPFALLCGALSLSLLLTQGALYLAIKTEAPIRTRALSSALFSGVTSIILFILGGVLLRSQAGYLLASTLDPNAAGGLLTKVVLHQPGAWLHNYSQYPWTQLAPSLGLFGLVMAVVLRFVGEGRVAFVGHSLGIVGVITTVGVEYVPLYTAVVTRF